MREDKLDLVEALPAALDVLDSVRPAGTAVPKAVEEDDGGRMPIHSRQHQRCGTAYRGRHGGCEIRSGTEVVARREFGRVKLRLGWSLGAKASGQSNWGRQAVRKLKPSWLPTKMG